MGRFALLITVAIIPATLIAQTRSSRSTRDGVFNTEQAERGRVAYQTNCASCHGVDLRGGLSSDRGDGIRVPSPALIGNAFDRKWVDLSLGSLTERIRITMPTTSAGSLSRRVAVDTLAFILQTGGYPAGTAELPPELRELDQIRIMRRN